MALDHGPHESGALWLDESSMAGFLFKVFHADRGPLAQWCRPVLWVWSAALVWARTPGSPATPAASCFSTGADTRVFLPAGNDCTVAAARRLIRSHMEELDTRRTQRKAA